MSAVTEVRVDKLNIERNSGQIAVGNHILQIGSVNGGVVYVAGDGQTAVPRARPTPINLRPRPFRGFVGRQKETRAAINMLEEAAPVQFYSEPSWGKTSLLRNLAYRFDEKTFPDGIVYLRVAGLPGEDVCQNLFDAFYETDLPLKPADAQLRQALQTKQALILLDDVDVGRENLEALLDLAPRCTFLFASPERQLWAEGRTLPVQGLAVDAALALIEQELDRKLSAEERPAAASLCTAVKGNPLQIRQLAGLLREQNVSLPALVRQIAQSGERVQVNEQRLLARLLRDAPESASQLVAVLAAVDGAPLSTEQLAALSQVEDVEAGLETLRQKGLVTEEQGLVSLQGGLSPVVAQLYDLTSVKLRAVSYFTDRLAQGTLTAGDGAETAVPEIVQSLLNWTAQTGRWPEALQLARAGEGALALARQWGVWAQVLEKGLQAATAAGDRSAEAWGWHQIGTRALCLGETRTARSALVKALQMRTALGEHAAAALTRHNLRILLGPPPSNNGNSSEPKGSSGSGSGLGSGPLLWGALAVTAVVAILAVALSLPFGSGPVQGQGGGSGGLAPTTIVVQPTSTVTATETPTNTPTATVTPSATPTKTATATAVPTCVPQRPQGWVSYTVRPGDTLYSLARATGTTVAIVQQVNCLETAVIKVGQSLWLPTLPPTDTPTFTPTPALPDLVVAEASQTGPAEFVVSSGGIAAFPRIEVPFAVTVLNQGGLEADRFNVAVLTDGQITPFVVAGQEASVPMTTAPLAGGGQVTISGRLIYSAERQGQTVSLAVAADSCAVREAALTGCQIEESDETNNGRSLSLTLPVFEEPNTDPAVTIVQPQAKTVFLDGYDGYEVLDGQHAVVYYRYITVQAAATDGEDGDLSGDQVVWTTNRTDLQPAYLNNGAAPQLKLYVNECSTTEHVVTVTATDSEGAVGVDSMTIQITMPCGSGG